MNDYRAELMADAEYLIRMLGIGWVTGERLEGMTTETLGHLVHGWTAQMRDRYRRAADAREERAYEIE